MIANLDRDRRPVGCFQILSVAAVRMCDATAAAPTRHTDQAALMARQVRQSVKVQALPSFLQRGGPLAEAFSPCRNLLLANQQTHIANEALLPFSQHSTDRARDISILY